MHRVRGSGGHRWIVLGCLLGLMGCQEETEEPTPIDYDSLDRDDDGFTPAQGDCNDRNDDIHPDAPETCANLTVDNDCDGSIDASEAIDPDTWYPDTDGDAFGATSGSLQACTAPTGYTAQAGDCNDDSALYHPGAVESCIDAIDYNCDGSIGLEDQDGDGYPACQDCNDGAKDVSPGAAERCNGMDDDCDVAVDEDAVDAGTWYPDADRDGYGRSDAAIAACTVPAGYTGNPGDCDDEEPAYNPGAIELCNGVDDNCDGTVDTDVSTPQTYYEDNDDDGYGDPDRDVLLITCTPPQGLVANDEDCDDQEDAVNPAATELCNERDDDCDGIIDESGLDGSSCDPTSQGHALLFDGGDYVQVPGSDQLHLTSAFTLEVWVRTTDCLDAFCDVAFVAKHTCGFDNGFYLGLYEDGVAQFYVQGLRLRTGEPINDGQWHHLAGVYDDGQATLYRDGTLEASDSIRYTITSSSLFFVGAASAGCGGSIAELDDLQLWDVRRTEGEIASDLQGSLEGNEPGLLAWYPFDEGEGQVVNDASVNGRDGVLGSSSSIDAADAVWVADGP